MQRSLEGRRGFLLHSIGGVPTGHRIGVRRDLNPPEPLRGRGSRLSLIFKGGSGGFWNLIPTSGFDTPLLRGGRACSRVPENLS